MKKLLLLMVLSLAVNVTFSQVVLNIVSPSNIANSLTHAYVDSAQGTSPWNYVPDMDSCYNALTDTVVMGIDSLGCTPLTNDLTGKIALIYRGACEFGTKALNAQNAGAVACIIVNSGGAPIGMGAGADGNNVTIPVTMVGSADGAIIQQALDNGDDVIVYFGPQFGCNNIDLGLDKGKALVARAAAIPNAITQDASEFNVPLGCWVTNYGSDDYVGATVSADVSFNSGSVYNQTSASFDLISGDSTYVTFPTFSQSTYADGDYEITYSINHSVTDDVTANDEVSFMFTINEEYYSLSPMNVTTGEHYNLSSIRIPEDAGSTFVSSTSCLVFADSNASRLAARGVSFSASTYDPLVATTLVGEYIEIIAYSWDDNFLDLDDGGFGVSSLTPLATTEYSYDADDQNVLVNVDFEEAILLDDNQRYLFCITSYNEYTFYGYDNSISYDLNTEEYRQPITMINNGTTWYTGYQGNEPTLTLRVLNADAASVEDREVEITAYPNPTTDVITIPLTGLNGKAELFVTDMAGKIVKSMNVNMTGGNLQVDVTELSAGYYTFTMNFEDGKVANFNVAVTK